MRSERTKSGTLPARTSKIPDMMVKPRSEIVRVKAHPSRVTLSLSVVWGARQLRSFRQTLYLPSFPTHRGGGGRWVIIGMEWFVPNPLNRNDTILPRVPPLSTTPGPSLSFLLFNHITLR